MHGYARSLRMEQRSLPWGAPPVYAGCVMPENDQAHIYVDKNCDAGACSEQGVDSRGVEQPALWPP